MPRHYDDDDDEYDDDDDDEYEENDDDDDDDDLPDWFYDLDAMPDSFWDSFDDGDFEIEIFEIGIDYGEDT